MRKTLQAGLMAGVLASAGLLAGAAPAQATTYIQPGARIMTAATPCTIGFAFNGTGSKAGKVYVSTAAHCITQGVGEQIWLVDTQEQFGQVAAVGSLSSAATDWALIEVYSSFHSRVSGKMKDSSAYPTGYTQPSNTNVGDAVKVPENRDATVVSDTTEEFRVSGNLVPGDSGGPLAHVPSGKALGTLSQGYDCQYVLGLPVLCQQYGGPTVQGILAKTNTAGFPLSLRTS